MKRNKRPFIEKPRMCDPGQCDHCEYIGDGDFTCDYGSGIPVIVVSDWEPTKEAGRCRKRGGRR